MTIEEAPPVSPIATQETVEEIAERPQAQAGPLPCPFCGSAAVVEPWQGGRLRPDPSTAARIVSCAGPCHVVPMVTADSEAEAVRLWNRRPGEARPC